MSKHTLPCYTEINSNFDPVQMEGETFLPVPGYPGYEVSDFGRVVSYKRGRPRILKNRPHPHGYRQAILFRDGKTKHHLIHRLVAQAHLGPAPDGKSNVLHANDIPADNRLPNLRYGTQSENQHDRVLNGNDQQANKVHCPRGHSYIAANTRTAYGRRYCISCQRARGVARYAEKTDRPIWFEWHALNVFMSLTAHADADLTPVPSPSFAA